MASWFNMDGDGFEFRLRVKWPVLTAAIRAIIATLAALAALHALPVVEQLRAILP